MKKLDFQELVDRNLSGLSWDEQRRRQVLHALAEEEKPVRKISMTVVLVAVIVCLSVTALAAGLVFARRVDTARLAEEALYHKYGLTGEMLGFFSRETDEQDGIQMVRYDGVDAYAYVLGSYTVCIRGGETEVSWSWDGTDAGGGFDGRVWGAQQLAEMCRVSRESHTTAQYAEKALAIAAADGVCTAKKDAQWEEDVRARQTAQQHEAEKAQNGAKLTPAQMEAIAREAVIIRYAFDGEQAAHLAPVDENGRYLLFGEEQIPCYEFEYALGFDEDGYTGEKGTGLYFVTVNAKNGTVEDILYDSALAGNG